MHIVRMNSDRRETVSIEVVLPIVTVMSKVVPLGKRLKRFN